MINYQIKMEEIIANNQKENKVPTLLLHGCCGPCSSAVLERLADYFKITLFYYNPNISSEEEYDRRFLELEKIILGLNLKNKITLVKELYNPKEYFDAVRGFVDLGEGSERCFKCYHLRLEETAIKAKELGFDYFTTTLSISPHKNSQVLNEIGYQLEDKYNVSYLCADFKKKNGYKRSIELSNIFGLYRQDYCGCIYSKKESEDRKLIA